ncbi:hypothetical protein G5714_015365 [Onychostoma macrolepis]|uniref:Uncharacterized protein n=1 Tax=Onychostoma macrolepis TaxID=369639 RepID=A0A7J6CAP2_9TELE|nr:hypothetical protein G5714_015365 [Onychostoma macrolepis]
MFLLSPVRLTLFLLVFLDVPHPSLQGRNKGRWNKGGWREVLIIQSRPPFYGRTALPSQAASNPFCGIKGRAVILAAAPGEDSLLLIRSPWVSQALQTLVFKESPVLRVSPITALQWLFLISPVELACLTPVCIPTHACLAPPSPPPPPPP